MTRTGHLPVLVACSGGRDSMALLRATYSLFGSTRVVCGHVEHGTRSEAVVHARELERFCTSQGLRFVSERLTPPSQDEATLRALRYTALARMLDQTGCTHILMAHTQEDQAESVLIGLLRGGRLASLAGIPSRNGPVLRPWLYMSRASVHRYLDQKKWPHWEDSSNREPMYLRNRIRKELLPLLEQRYGRSTAERLSRLARECTFSVESRSVEDLNTEYRWINNGISVRRMAFRSGLCEQVERRILVDTRVIREPRIRLCRPDDRVWPTEGSGKGHAVWDLLAARGVTFSVRTRFPVVTDDEDRIVWIPSVVRGNRGEVSDTTKEVWIFSIED